MSSISFSSSSLTDPELLGEISKVRAKLSAVELALMSLSEPGTGEQRRERLRQRQGTLPWLALYLDDSKEQLLKKEDQLQQEKLFLLEEKRQLQEKERQLLEKELLLLRKKEREGECLRLPLGVLLRAVWCVL